MARIAILGAGQLARMLAEAANSMKHEVAVLSNRPDESACQLGFVQTYSTEALNELGAWADRILVESEFLDLTRLSADIQSKMFPKPESLQLLRSKKNQRQIASKLGLSQPRFKQIDLEADFDLSPHELLNKLGFDRAMLKWTELGYDGYGNLVVSESTASEVYKDFLRRAFEKKVEVIAEEFVHFQKELAIVGSRSESEFIFYPLVWSEQKNNVCSKVRGPAKMYGFDLQKKAEDFARLIAKESGLMGSFAIEFFYVEPEHLLLNEVAPRVHNSGHYSLLNPVGSQFANHIRAALHEPLQGFEEKAFGMLNLLAPSGSTGPYELDSNAPEDFDFYWYQKSELRPGRKMGHINFWATNAAEIDEKFEILHNWEEIFWKQSIKEKA